jgi:GDP-D-mannose 3',5'-epimerase
LRHPPFPPNVGGPGGQADEFLLLDLREPHNCWQALSMRRDLSTGSGQAFDEVYQLAADMGGMGFIHSCEP